MRAVLSLLQAGAGSDLPFDRQLSSHPKLSRPGWCKCDCCAPSSVPHEQLCCRQSDGACITSSPVFEQLVLRRSLLKAVLLYHNPLSSPAERGQTTAMRHCAYRQYISWRFGVPPSDSQPVIPNCCVRRVREEYPSLDGHYSGFRIAGMTSVHVCTH